MKTTHRQPLTPYRQKRNLERTPEPSGRNSHRRRKRPIFVIQKHEARQLHYDFRVEAEGALVSWAVPKGPSMDPREKRLARKVEDHPFDYADFEGVIPQGEYGAGTVIVWDRGTYQNTTEEDGQEVSVKQALKDGHLTIRLRGRKLKGGYALTRTGQGSSKRWLLVKMKDKQADARRNPVSTQPRSVLTRRTLEQVHEEEGNGN